MLSRPIKIYFKTRSFFSRFEGVETKQRYVWNFKVIKLSHNDLSLSSPMFSHWFLSIFSHLMERPWLSFSWSASRTPRIEARWKLGDCVEFLIVLWCLLNLSFTKITYLKFYKVSLPNNRNISGLFKAFVGHRQKDIGVLFLVSGKSKYMCRY